MRESAPGAQLNLGKLRITRINYHYSKSSFDLIVAGDDKTNAKVCPLIRARARKSQVTDKWIEETCLRNANSYNKIELYHSYMYQNTHNRIYYLKILKDRLHVIITYFVVPSNIYTFASSMKIKCFSVYIFCACVALLHPDIHVCCCVLLCCRLVLEDPAVAEPAPPVAPAPEQQKSAFRTFVEDTNGTTQFLHLISIFTF